MFFACSSIAALYPKGIPYTPLLPSAFFLSQPTRTFITISMIL